MTHLRFTLVFASLTACSRPLPPATPAPSPVEGPAPAPPAADANPRNDRCMRVRLSAGYACVPSPGGGAIVLTRDATAATDPCPSAECPANTRCESSPQPLGERTYLLPRCAAPAGAVVQPHRDPCASYLCPTAYHCTAPADAPYCVPDQGDW